LAQYGYFSKIIQSITSTQSTQHCQGDTNAALGVAHFHLSKGSNGETNLDNQNDQQDTTVLKTHYYTYPLNVTILP
jgi:hypothetical protein